MKRGRGGFRPLKREQVLDQPRQDSYEAEGKLREPTRCPDCGATFQRGRWTWKAAPGGAHEKRCPACQRVKDRFPAGYVALSGAFFAAHREEILAIARNREAAEKARHPLQRIMAVEDGKDGAVITTTDAHLARRIAESIHDACAGGLAMRYSKDENAFRATWTR